MEKQKVLVIGAGLAGMKASLLLANAGVDVCIVEKESYIGGQTIKFEEVYPNMECATCMVSPIQQDVLQNSNIELHMLSELEKVTGEAGRFKVNIHKKARYVSLVNCIGCGACYEPCPAELDNEFEEGLSKKKAIAVPCAGALPNVPAIDPENCLHLNGKKKDCRACQEACVFDAIDFTEKDEKLDLEVAAILVATGFDVFDESSLPQFGYGKLPNVYSAMEFERLYAQNGPTEGQLILRDDKELKSIGIIHCVGREEQGYCSAVCCMYSAKFAHFLKHKVPKAAVHEFYTDLCIPGKSHQRFYEETLKKGVNFVHFGNIRVGSHNGNLQINYTDGNGKENSTQTDMIVLSPAMIPGKNTEQLAEILGITLDKQGFFSTQNERLSPVTTEKEGIFVTGCAEGPKDIPDSIAQAEAAAGKILASLS
ncbi:MAG: FAD-dependent oxidoreductase [Candidatus Aminicenantes bacterium]|jgi:heterodisulfide reductase subunit A